MRTSWHYDVSTDEERRMCDEKPTLLLTATEQRTDHWTEDGAAMTKEHPPRVIATVNVKPDGEQG